MEIVLAIGIFALVAAGRVDIAVFRGLEIDSGQDDPPRPHRLRQQQRLHPARRFHPVAVGQAGDLGRRLGVGAAAQIGDVHRQ